MPSRLSSSSTWSQTCRVVRTNTREPKLCLLNIVTVTHTVISHVSGLKRVYLHTGNVQVPHVHNHKGPFKSIVIHRDLQVEDDEWMQGGEAVSFSGPVFIEKNKLVQVSSGQACKA